MRPGLLALPLGLLLLTGCASSPQTEVRQDVRAVLAAANDEDADAVRTAVEDLLATLREQVGSEELTAAQADEVSAAAKAVLAQVALLEAAETPSPTPTPPPAPEPSPTPSPSPSPSPTPTPTPTPSPEPEPTQVPPETTPPQTDEPDEPEEPTEPEQTTEPEDDAEDQATVVPPLPAGGPTSRPTPAL